MLITSLLDNKAIKAELVSRSKPGVIEELVGCLVSQRQGLVREEIVNALLEREKLGSTAIGKGVAIPHAKAKGIENVVAAFGRSSQGIDFGAEDGKPVHLFFLLVAPLDKAGEHLKALAKIAQLVKDESFKKSLLAAKNHDAIFKLIKDKDEEAR